MDLRTFLGGFQTGASMWHWNDEARYPDYYAAWKPARDIGAIKWGMCGQRAGTLHADGSMTGNWNDTSIADRLARSFSLNAVPVISTTRLTNWLREDCNPSGDEITYDMMRNFFAKWGNWLNANHPGKFFVWIPAAEHNYPAEIHNSNDRNVHWTTFNEKMAIMRKARDDLGLQNKILLGSHGVLGWWAMDSLNEMLTNFESQDHYNPGYALADIIGFSHYSGQYDASRNPSDADWRTTIDHAWRRAKIIRDRICAIAGRQLPFMWMEFSVGHCYKYKNIWKEGVTYIYDVMVKNNTWVKGLSWYCGKYIDDDAMLELARLAPLYDNYGYTPVTNGGGAVVALLILAFLGLLALAGGE